jgi:hypothetical protein
MIEFEAWAKNKNARQEALPVAREKKESGK